MPSVARRFTYAALFLPFPAIAFATVENNAPTQTTVASALSVLNAPVLPQATVPSGEEPPLLAQAGAEDDQPVDVYGYQRKSPTRAFLQSFFIPGWGQLYAKSAIWKPIMFVGIEVAGWAGYASYHGNGNDIEDQYRAFADAHWDDSSYVWGLYEVFYERDYAAGDIRDHWDTTGRWIDTATYYPGTDSAHSHSHHAWYKDNGDRVDDDEFYENIGKYDQFNSGWDDYPDIGTDSFPDGPKAATYSYVSPNRRTYLKMRDDSNSEYNKANTLLVMTVANHLISGFWAALDARAYNKSKDQFGQVEPRLRLVRSPASPQKLMPFVTLGYRF